MRARVAPHKLKRRQSQRNFQPHLIIYDHQQKLSEKCRICSEPNHLISVCDCDIKYHQKCLLKYIKLQMKQSFVKYLPFAASNIKCPVTGCQKQINFTYEQKSRYGCQYFCQKLQENYCNKYIVLMFVLLIILSAFLFVTIYTFSFVDEDALFILFVIFSFLTLMMAIAFIAVFFICFWKYFLVREIFLKNIILPGGRSTEGHSSSSSDENKVYENISENFEIYVQD